MLVLFVLSLEFCCLVWWMLRIYLVIPTAFPTILKDQMHGMVMKYTGVALRYVVLIIYIQWLHDPL